MKAIFSETAANLVQHGRYAFTVQSPNQLNDLDFRISVGPAVILPVALAYKLFGVSLVSGRLVAGAYLVLTFLALFLAARRLWGSATGACWPWPWPCWAPMSFTGAARSWGISRPWGSFSGALFFIIRGLESRPLWPLFLGGLFLGLAFDAKEFYGLAFLPPLVLLARQNWREQAAAGPQRPGFSPGGLAACWPTWPSRR